LPQASVGFPNIPGVTYNGVPAFADRWDWGPTFDQGFLTILPPAFLGSPYPRYVPKTDADGNGLGGVRLPEVAVPLATYSGWNLRAPAFGGDDLCTTAGQMIAFAPTRTERLASGDPRLSIEERYPNHGKYVSAVARAANALHRQRFLLNEDVERIIEAAAESSIGKYPRTTEDATSATVETASTADEFPVLPRELTRRLMVPQSIRSPARRGLKALRGGTQ
jgi:hypothetical protein